jgi:adenine C2-methylase RlmN of 23S rRNA A2503 and tRNA A37
LESEGITVTQRHEFGQDIAGACGQLATNNKK